MHHPHSKNFEAVDIAKAERLHRLKACIETSLVLIKIDRYGMTKYGIIIPMIKHFFCLYSEYVKGQRDQSNFDDLPTEQVLFSEEEREFIGIMRKCKKAKELCTKVLRNHDGCLHNSCNFERSPDTD